MSDGGMRRVPGVPAVRNLGQALNEEPARPAPTRVEVVRTGLEKALEQGKQIQAKTQAKVKEMQDRGVVLIRDPQFQTVTITTASGAVTFGAVGGAFGGASGIVVGSSAGLLPALFTFGLSIPAGAALGGAIGTFLGSAAGSTAGGLAGFTAFKYRAEIRENVLIVKVKVEETTVKLYVALKDLTKRAREQLLLQLEDVATKAHATHALAHLKVAEVAKLLQHTATEATTLAKNKVLDAVDVLSSTRSGVTATTALAGGVAAGVTGGVAGAVTGVVIGAVPALFTFGLSIPVGATIGLCTGATAGGAAGVVGGGAAGLAGFTYRKEIASSAEYVRNRAHSSAAQVSERVKSLYRSSTGGTA